MCQPGVSPWPASCQGRFPRESLGLSLARPHRSRLAGPGPFPERPGGPACSRKEKIIPTRTARSASPAMRPTASTRPTRAPAGPASGWASHTRTAASCTTPPRTATTSSRHANGVHRPVLARGVSFPRPLLAQARLGPGHVATPKRFCVMIFGAPVTSTEASAGSCPCYDAPVFVLAFPPNGQPQRN